MTWTATAISTCSPPQSMGIRLSGLKTWAGRHLLLQPTQIATNAWGVNALFAGDADQDGDADLFAASDASNSIVWHENNGAGDPAFAEHVISFYSADAHSVFAADIDGDGDLDVLAASRGDGKIAWYENLGGQYLVTTLADELLNGNLQTLLRLIVTHRGWPSDPNLALQRLVLRFTDAAGQPLTTPRLASLVRRLSISRDQGDGLFSPSSNLCLSRRGNWFWTTPAHWSYRS